MTMSLLVIAFLVAMTVANPVVEWNKFKNRYGKEYKEIDNEMEAMKIFFNNKKIIEAHNEKYDEGLVKFKMGMNFYGDMTEENINAVVNQQKFDEKEFDLFYVKSEKKLPERVDWRELGAVTPVKDQGLFGSCWAFSAIGALEGQYAIKHEELVSLSEQNLIDCSTGNNESANGSVISAFRYAKKKGINSENSYRYTAKKGECKFEKSNVKVTSTGYKQICRGKEDDLMDAVAFVGPISIGIYGGLKSFHFYSEGIYEDSDCYPLVPNHSALVVGYGSEEGEDYWLVKNSRGTTWGDKGYIKIVRNKNMCGIANFASYPIIF